MPHFRPITDAEALEIAENTLTMDCWHRLISVAKDLYGPSVTTISVFVSTDDTSGSATWYLRL